MSQSDFDTKVRSMLEESVPLIHAGELYRCLSTEEEVVILDSRTSKEYQISHLSGAVFVDYDRFSVNDVEGLNKEAPIVVYCSVGYRSEKIGERLQELGFKKVYNLFGGIFDWKNKGYPVVNTRGNVTDSVHTYNKNWSQWLEKGIKVYE